MWFRDVEILYLAVVADMKAGVGVVVGAVLDDTCAILEVHSPHE